jgi:3-polyprenyl-4-hydroxybenzoate decarboxylase
MGMDDCAKWPGESKRPWGEVIEPSDEIIQKINDIWPQLGL